MKKETFGEKFKRYYQTVKQQADRNASEDLANAKEEGGFAYYVESTAQSRMAGLPAITADAGVALVKTIKEIIHERKAKNANPKEMSADIKEKSADKSLQESQFAETKSEPKQTAGPSEDKKTSAPKLEPIDFSKIDFNHDGKPDIEQNIEEVMKVDVKQYVKEENTRDYIGDFDFAEDEPEIQEEQQVVQDYRSNRNRDDYDRNER